MEEKNRFEIEDTYGGNHENQGTYGVFVLKKTLFFREKSIFFKTSYINGDYVKGYHPFVSSRFQIHENA